MDTENGIIKPILMTKQGYDSLLERITKLKKDLDAAGMRAGEAAGPNCDWHDNPAYDQAIAETQMLARQVAEANHQIQNAKIIDNPVTADAAAVGTYVTIDMEGERLTFYIGGEVDSNPTKGLISHKSPLAQCILGAVAGSTRTFRSPDGPITVSVISIGTKNP